MVPVSIGEQLGAHRWIVRGFDFFIALTEVNVNHVRHGIFNESLEPRVDFRLKLGEEMIGNPYPKQERAELRRSKRMNLDKDTHKLMICPPYQKFKGGELVTCKIQYYQKCFNCKKTRTHCSYSPGKFMCVGCFGEHVREPAFVE